MIETLQPILAEHPFFHGMERSLLDQLVGCACAVRFEKDNVIFREGEAANKFYLIRSGQVALQLFADRAGPLVITTLEQGDILGWSWLSEPYRWKFTARALRLPGRFPWMENACVKNRKLTTTWDMSS